MKALKSFLKKHYSAALLCCIVVAMSCTDKFDYINTDKNAITPPLAASQLPFLFSAALQRGTNSGWDYQIAQNLFHDQYCQYFANTTTYFPSDRLVIRMDWIGALWVPLYTATVPQLTELMDKFDATT